MFVYVVSFVINMLIGVCLLTTSPRKANKQRKKIYLFLTTVQFALIAGWRGGTVGYDTQAYEMIFSKTPDSFSTILNNKQYIELGFSVFCSLIKILGGSFQTMLIVSSFFVVGSCCVFIYRHSLNVLLSVFIIISFPFYYSSFDIIRHFMATAFFLLGYKYIEENKFGKYCVFIALGSLFHSVSWLFLPYYFIKRIKWNKKTAFIAIVTTIVVYFSIEPLAIWVSGILNKGSGITSGWIGAYGGGEKTAIMYGVIVALVVIVYNKLNNKTIDDQEAVNHVVLLCMFSIVFINARMIIRMLMSSIPLLSISIPRIYDSERCSKRSVLKLAKFAFYVVAFVYHGFMLITNWQNVIPYVPYWK